MIQLSLSLLSRAHAGFRPREIALLRIYVLGCSIDHKQLPLLSKCCRRYKEAERKEEAEAEGGCHRCGCPRSRDCP